MNVPFLIYDATGMILRTGSVPEGSVEQQAQDGEYALVGDASPGTHYVDLTSIDPILTERPETTVTASVDGTTVTLSGVQFGATVTVTGDAETSFKSDDEDGVIELDFELPGTYRILCQQFPELDFSITVTI